MRDRHAAGATTQGAQPLVSSLDLSFQGGPILISPSVYMIFWGTSWTNSTFVGDKITGLTSFYQGLSGSGYATIPVEYPGPGFPPTYITPRPSLGGSDIDNSAAPGSTPTNAQILAEIAKVLQQHGDGPTAFGVYAVYATTPPGSGFCAFHGSGAISGTTVQFLWIPDLDNVAVCNPGDISGLHSEGLAAIANVSAHELTEATTDPHANAWYSTSDGYEIGDRCAWVFTAALTTLSNGARFKLQDEWSNAANDGGYGAAGDASGQLNGSQGAGCLSGQTWPRVASYIVNGPNNPAYIPTMMYCTWTGVGEGGTPPYTYNWQASGSNILPIPNGAQIQIYAYSPGSDIQLTLSVTDSKGAKSSATGPRYAESMSNYFNTSYCSSVQ
jgi:hypothetical protein